MGTQSGRKEKGKQANNIMCIFKIIRKLKKSPTVTVFSLGYVRNEQW